MRVSNPNPNPHPNPHTNPNPNPSPSPSPNPNQVRAVMKMQGVAREGLAGMTGAPIITLALP